MPQNHVLHYLQHLQSVSLFRLQVVDIKWYFLCTRPRVCEPDEFGVPVSENKSCRKTKMLLIRALY